MKIKSLLGVLMLLLILTSCNSNKESKKETPESKKEEFAENLKKVNLEIEGMTCEIGCARLIQSKVSKLEGVKFVSVDFENKSGVVEFDANKISQNEINVLIEGVGGGDLYRVVNSNLVESSSLE